MYQQYLGQAKAAIAYLSTQELNELIDDNEKLEERINNVLNVLDQEKQVLITENRNIAEENVNKEPEIVERKSRISELSDQGKTLCTSVQEKLQEIKSRRGDTTPDTALALLQTAAAQCEEKSEEIATKFQEKEITIEEYLEQFMAARKLMHSRKLKTDKMQELLRQPQNTPGPMIPGGGIRMPGYPPMNFYPSPAAGAPYPPYGMPMPNQPYRNF